MALQLSSQKGSSSAAGQHAGAQALLVVPGTPSGSGSTGWEAGLNHVQSALGIAQQRSTRSSLLLGGFCCSSTALGTEDNSPFAVLLLWALLLCMVPGEQARIKSSSKASRQLTFWSLLCFCTSLSLGGGRLMAHSSLCTAAAGSTAQEISSGWFPVRVLPLNSQAQIKGQESWKRFPP